MKKRKQPWLLSKFSVLLAAFITIVCIVTIGIVYYWSYYFFGHIFEDQIIDHYSDERNLAIGVDNEWILGVTTHHIDVVEAIHGTVTSKHIYEDALKQIDRIKAYREKVNDKYIMYMIEMDVKDGEKVYKYSIIKDIYREVLPQIFSFIVVCGAFIFYISIKFTRIITKNVYGNIDKLKDYANQLAYYNLDTRLDVDTDDDDIMDLAKSFVYMKDRLKDKNDMQQSMLQYISHELKTPIMIIESYASSAKDSVFPKGSLSETLDTIMKQTERMNNKVEDLLLIAKISAEDVVGTVEPVDIRDVLVTVVKNIKYTDPSKTIMIDIPENIIVPGNKERLQILFENMINNQISYSDSQIIIRAFVKKQKLTFLFYNDGAPIAYENREFLFRPFTKGYPGGHGLGLSICKRIIDTHNGEISLKKTERGTLFQIVFPYS